MRVWFSHIILWDSDKDEILLTNNGQPVKTDDVVPFISGVLSENLDCCIKEAKNDLKHSNGKVYLIWRFALN